MTSEENTLNLAAGCLRDLLAGPELSFIQELLPAYLVRQRWFGAKSRTIVSVRVLNWVELPAEAPGVEPNQPEVLRTSNLEPRTSTAAIVFIQIAYAESEAEPDIYQLLLALTTG